MRKASAWTVGGCCWLLALAWTTPNASAQTFSAGLRYWHADWDVTYEGFRSDLGSSPFFIGYFGVHDAGFSVVGQLGYGDGWDYDISRLDLSIAVTRTDNLFTYGLGLRRMGYEQGEEEIEWSYIGPELMAGLGYPLEGTDLAIQVSGNLGLYLWQYEEPQYEDDGSTIGYSLDAGLGYRIDTFVLRGGYRVQFVEEDDRFAGDEFRGPYIEVGMMF